MNQDEFTPTLSGENQSTGAAVAAPVVETSSTEETKKSIYKEPSWAQRTKKGLKKYRTTLWFILPAAFFTLVFSYIPMLGILYSFKDPGFFDIARNGVLGSLFKGDWTFLNYINIFVDNGKFWLSIGNTLLINVIKLVICFPLSIFIAVQLSELKNQFFSKLILIIICLPNFLSWAIVIGLWTGMLDSQGGVINEFLVWLGLNKPDNFLMAKNNMFKFWVIFLGAWKGAGWGSIMFYAAIMSIDKTYYESATLEGANRLQKMWYLTLPSIIPTIALMLVMNISGMMAAGFEQIYTMMQVSSELQDTQITLDTYIYDVSIVHRSDTPFATALGVFNGLIALALMLIGNKITTKFLHRSLW